MDKDSLEYQYSLKGAKRSAELRRKYANEKTREVIHDAITGCRIVIKETVAFRYNGRRHTLIPLDLVDEYPITFVFDNHASDSMDDIFVRKEQTERTQKIKVKGSMKEFKRHALAIAASGTMVDEDGIPEKLVLWPEDFGAGKEAWYMRLEIWADFLTKEIDRRRDSEHLAAPSVDHDGDPLLDTYNIIDCLPDANSDFSEDLAFSNMVEDLISHLDEQDKKIFNMRVLDDKMIKEVAEELDCAISTINYRMEKKIIPTIRELAAKEGLFSKKKGGGLRWKSWT